MLKKTLTAIAVLCLACLVSPEAKFLTGEAVNVAGGANLT